MPRMIYAAVLSLVFAGSVVIRRPLVGILIGLLYRAPSEWVEDRRVRRAFGEVTLAWAGLFAFRAIVYLVLISAGKAGWLAVASVAMGWPAFLLLLFLSYRYVPRRLAQLGAPPRPEPPMTRERLGAAGIGGCGVPDLRRADACAAARARSARPRGPTPWRGDRRR